MFIHYNKIIQTLSTPQINAGRINLFSTQVSDFACVMKTANPLFSAYIG